MENLKTMSDTTVSQDIIDEHNMRWIVVNEDEAVWLKSKLEEPANINPFLQDALRRYDNEIKALN